MEWLELIADWILIPLIIVYGFTSWAKDNPDKSIPPLNETRLISQPILITNNAKRNRRGCVLRQ